MSWDDDARWGSRSREGYDAMQVCRNGHLVNSMARTSAQYNEKFCSKCGAQTITNCERCSAEIRGYYHRENVFGGGPNEAPRFCHECGAAYPWQQAAMEALTELLKDEGLSESDIEAVTKALPDVVQETPRTETASFKIKRVLTKLGKEAYGVAIKVVSDVASEAAKKALGL